MELEMTLKEACNGLKATRITERKKSAEIIKEFLTRNSVPSLLTGNTFKKKGYSWNHLFDDLNEFIIKETEKYESSKSFDGVTRPLCASLLNLCVSGSIKGRAYIKCEKIMEMCIFVLSDKRLSGAVGDGYLHLLFKHVLPCQYYVGFISPTTWKHLLDLSLDTCFSNQSQLDNFTKLRLILLILKNGTENCQFVGSVIEKLHLFEKYFLKIANDKKVQDVITEIIILLLETLSAEYRLTMCAFIENLLPMILKFYDQNKEQKKKMLLFKLLVNTVTLHHPQGRRQQDEGSLAHNWEQWNKCLNSITELICLEVVHMQKTRRPNEVLQKSLYFHELAAAVYYQIFKLSEYNESYDESATKRLKLNFNNNRAFSDLISQLQQNHLSWMSILHVYVKKYGGSIVPRDYLNLLNCLQTIWTNNNSNLDWSIFHELTCMVLQNLKNSDYKSDEDDNILISLWNSSIRNCTSTTESHIAAHMVLQKLFSLDMIKDLQGEHLIKLYVEKDMPVTNHSVNTLNKFYEKCYNKCSADDIRSKCFTWLTADEINGLPITGVTVLLLRLVANENINISEIVKIPSEYERLCEILFNSNEEYILFTEFEIDSTITVLGEDKKFGKVEAVIDLDNQIQEYFKTLIFGVHTKLRQNESELMNNVKSLRILVSYLDAILKYNVKTSDDVLSMDLFVLLKKGLTSMYMALKNTLQADGNIALKHGLLQLVKELLVSDYTPLIAGVIRSTIDGELFYAINSIINTEIPVSDNDVYISGDEDEVNFDALKYNCFYVLAAYCKKNTEFRDEILKLVLDDGVYDFNTDLQCIFKTLDILTDSTVDDPPLGLIFSLMQSMCQKLYRNSVASFGILKVLVKIIDELCIHDTIKRNNCFIMIKSYMQLCADMHYPPEVACLVYECAAKLIVLNEKQDDALDTTFEDAFMNKIKGNIHSIRLYCCYLLKLINDCKDNDIERISTDLLEIFLIEVSNDSNGLLLKDESSNRTATVLHYFLSLAQSKPSAIQNIILQVIQLEKTKSLDNNLVTKVLNKIGNAAGLKDLQVYLNSHILSVIHFWFAQKHSVEELPIALFGYDDIDLFLEKHKGWLVAGDVLWRHHGNVTESDLLNYVAALKAQQVDNILEECFPNIIALALPYIVSEKYHIEYYSFDKRNEFKYALTRANKMFKDTCNILKNKWNDLFLENLGHLLLIAAAHMRDYEDAREVFDVKLSLQEQAFHYPKSIFLGVLDYFESLTDENVIQYLCRNQTTVIYKILLELWRTVIQENIFEHKVLALHSFVTFVRNIPLGVPSDAFVSNYVCSCFTDAIRNCSTKNDIKIYLIGLRSLLDYILPHKSHLMKRSLLELLPVLMIKNEDGFLQECTPFLHYLLNDKKSYWKDSSDVVDFVHSVSEENKDIGRCVNIIDFKEKLRGYKISLIRPSHETLQNLRKFLSSNKTNINILYNELDDKRFSEDCATSLIHQVVHALCDVMKLACDEKTIVEACNCLSEISSYDLKTLVTTPPANTDSIIKVDPKHYFSQVTVKALLDIFFDEDPNVTSEVADTLTNLLSCVDIDDILELEDVDKQIIKPLSPNITKSNDTGVDGAKFEEYYNLFPDGIFLNALLNKNKEDWLKEVTCTLLNFVNSKTNYVNNLRGVCILKSHVCRKILPALIGVLLQCLNEKHVEAMGKHMNNLFTYIYEQTFDSNISQNSGAANLTRSVSALLPDGYKTIVQYMLDIVDFVRIQRNHYKMRSGCAKKILNFLNLEYDKVAWASSMVDQNWAAIYYGELWANFQNNELTPSTPELTTRLPNGENLQRIFRKGYVSIGEMDAIEGCGTAHLTIENEKRKYLINTEQYSDALLLHDIALSCATQPDQELEYGVVRSLHKSGMHNLALRYIKTLPESDQLNDIKYECLTFLGDWSHFVDTKKLDEMHKQKGCNLNSVVKAFQYACLKNCLHVQTAPEFEDKLVTLLNKAKLAVSRLCHNLNMTNCQNIYKILEKLHMFRDIEDYFAVRSNRTELYHLLEKWGVDNLPRYHDFKHIEARTSQRVLILEHAVKSHHGLIDDVVSLQTKYAKMALNNSRVQMAQRLLYTAKKTMANDNIALVESEISWAKGHKELAMSLVRNVVDKQTSDVKLAAVSLWRYALWMADSKRDNPRDIISKYLQKSLNVLKQEHVGVRLKVYSDIAKFADAEYKQVVSYMNSSIFENRVKCVENMKGTETVLNKRPMKSLSKEEGRALATNRRFKELDEAEIANTRAERENFLQLAMRYYLLSLKECNDSNLSVFRVISLWLDNRDFQLSEGDGVTFEGLLHSIPSWKFVTILPQLAPRMTNENTEFMHNLKEILKRCASEHPHHALPILFLLKNSDKDSVITNSSGKSTSRSRGQEQEARVLAAMQLVDDLKRQRDENLTAIIEQMEKICDAIISFANHVPPSRTKKLKIPDTESIHKLRKLDNIPVPTVTYPIKRDCNYAQIHTFVGFANYYELVGGVNCPKKILCKDSSGRNHVLLIKGGDDLKQDAVMQQVFNIVNTLLEKDPVTSKKQLLIRTYKVVPLSRLSGVLEWCEGTLPIGTYLVGAEGSGAHARYRPQDISCEVARRKLIDCCNNSHEEKLAVYNKIARDFNPVFNYFFTERYLDPVTWYERRLAYTKSVATSSMVGYILGLGDRHLFNILIDERTAEVIHIDLGIAFDQGKTLRTPETVPFRLTRDIIAGFGCSGTEGIFRRCCEKTMQLLRDNQETLLTILEVLLCDPLYSWSVKTAQQNAPNSSATNNTICSTGPPSGLAERALLVVRSKLSGTEAGVAGGVGVAGQVARLLHAATDPFNLCRLFHGWQPYL